MPGLFAALSSSADALQVQQQALAVVGQNIANVNTAGYARRNVDLVEIAPTDIASPGGVAVGSISAARDMFVEQRLWREKPQAQQQDTTAKLLSVAETSVGVPGKSLDENLGALFDAFDQVAQDPTSGPARQSLQQQGLSIATAFHQISSQLTSVRTAADQQLHSSIASVQTYATQIAALNASIPSVGGGRTAAGQAVTDELLQAVHELSGILDIGVVALEDGQINVSYAGGRALVVGANVYAPTVVPQAGTGLGAVNTADGVDVTASLTTGTIGGVLNVRDNIVPGYLSQLDTLASTLVQQVNAVHTGGFDLNGTAGGNFFTPLTGVPGAAAAISLAAGIAADPSKIAAAATTASGDNQNARALANLRDAKVIGGASTLQEGWGTLIYQVGQDVSSATASQKTHADVVNQLENLRDSTSAVSIDEEGTSMLKFQRAYQANAKYFQTVNSTIDTLLGLLV